MVEWVVCPSCRRHVEAEARVCPFCGSDQPRIASPPDEAIGREVVLYGAPPRMVMPAYGLSPHVPARRRGTTIAWIVLLVAILLAGIIMLLRR